MTTSPQVESASTAYQTSTPRRQREAVLIVGHGDHFVEAFAARHVDVHIAIKPYLTSKQGEILAEQYLDETLPRRFAELYLPGNLRASALIKKIRPSEIAQRDWELELLRTLDRVASYGKEGRRIWTS